MEKKIFIKLFTLVSVFILSALSVFAEDMNYLKRLVIEPIDGNEYTLNFLFDTNYTGKAFLQKSGNNEYYIFLPDSTFSSNVKTTYTNLKDKRNIQFNIITKPIIKNNSETKYIRINVYMNDNYKLRLISGLSRDYHPFIIGIKKAGAYSAIILLLFAITGFILLRIIKKVSNMETNSYTSFPVNFDTSYKMTQNLEPIKNKDEIQRVIIPKNNTNKPLSSKLENKFECFNIESDSKLNNNTYEIKSSLNETSNLLNDKSNTVKLKHTNPIVKKENIEESELSMPLADEVLPKPKDIKSEINSDKPEILSVLKLTANKGFYLISEKNTFKLFGFVNKNIFQIAKFKDLSQINLQARYYDNSGKNEIYIVKLDSYKAMIEISDSSMKELAKI